MKILHKRKPVQKQASLYVILALGTVLFIMLIPQDLETFFSTSGMLWKISLGETEVFLLWTVSPKNFIMESVLMWLQMNQTLLERELPDI